MRLHGVAHCCFRNPVSNLGRLHSTPRHATLSCSSVLGRVLSIDELHSPKTKVDAKPMRHGLSVCQCRRGRHAPVLPINPLWRSPSRIVHAAAAIGGPRGCEWDERPLIFSHSSLRLPLLNLLRILRCGSREVLSRSSDFANGARKGRTHQISAKAR